MSLPSLTPSLRSSSRASGVNRSSLIPVPSTSKRNGLFNSGNFASSTPKANDEEKFKKGHRKWSTEFTESVGSIHPHTSIYGACLGMRICDEESVSEFAPRSTTPDTRPSNSLAEDPPSEPRQRQRLSPPSSPPRQCSPVQTPGVSSNDEAHSPLDTSRSQEHTMPTSFAPPGTPPMTSPAPQDGSSSGAIPTFALTTPPCRLSSSTSILDFRTPSPPHDLSNLSALQSSSEDEAETHEADVTPMRVGEDGLINPNYTAMKTPPLPGAWAATPVPPKRETSPPPTSSELAPTASSSSMPLSQANTEAERSSRPRFRQAMDCSCQYCLYRVLTLFLYALWHPHQAFNPRMTKI
ncbi:hypothetical protein EV702DRAFT_1202371 [Suillus placidus]|uniref:Uncharacterized protein n=1 Tax=Suillus placidus TaxID=48579 RepID=A0A9P7CYG1_9AGAM|nr:hypothetical protein EV702DRAFT_1202371 [Suillus placidus]